MNHCFDCNSSYAAPGTCNCFAPGGKRYVAPATAPGTSPLAPITLPRPTWVPPISPSAQPYPTLRGVACPVCGKVGCCETHVIVSSSGAITRHGPGPSVTFIGGIDGGGNCAAIQ